MKNKAAEGRPPLCKVYAIVRAQYEWFDFLKANRHVYAIRQMEQEAWAHWQPVLRGLRFLRSHHQEMRRRVTKLRREQCQLTLSLDVTSKEV